MKSVDANAFAISMSDKNAAARPVTAVFLWRCKFLRFIIKLGLRWSLLRQQYWLRHNLTVLIFRFAYIKTNGLLTYYFSVIWIFADLAVWQKNNQNEIRIKRLENLFLQIR